MALNYVVTAQRSTGVTHSLVANFTGPQDVNLILAKGSRLVINMVGVDGLHGIHDVPLYGKITALESYRLLGERQDLLFILTDKYNFCVLGYDPKTREIKTRGSGSVVDKIGRAVDAGQLVLMDTQCRLIGLYLYEGLLKVIPIDARGNLKDAFNVRLDELSVVDIKFLYGCSKPTIAVLYQDAGKTPARHLKTYVLDIKNKKFEAGPWRQSNVQKSAGMLIAVPDPMGGVLVLGEQSVMYYNGISVKATPIDQAVITAAGKIDENGSRYLVGDASGKMHVIVLSPDAGGTAVESVHVEALGQTSCASCITYLDSSIVFVGSVFGDSLLIRLSETINEDDSYIEVVETFQNVGPILDMCLVDLDKQGQAQAITCSGVQQDSSLRIVRNGIGINEQASIELQGIKGMWSLRPASDAEFDKYLVQAFTSETRVLAIEEDEMAEVEIAGFLPGRTLFCGNVIGNLVVQVTEAGAVLVDSQSMTSVMTWQPPSGLSVIVATGNTRHVALACSGGKLFHLEVDAAGRTLQQKAETQLEHEIACLSLNPAANTAAVSTATRSSDVASSDSPDAMAVDEPAAKESKSSKASQLDGFLAVGVWTDMTVRLLALGAVESPLHEITRVPLGGDTQARAVLLVTLDDQHLLLVGLGDGHVLSFPLEVSATGDAPPELKTPRKVSLGTQPIGLSCFVSNNAACVFVSSDRPTVIYSKAGKVLYANVNSGGLVNSVCTFHSEPFPDCLSLSNESTLTIGTMDAIEKLHIRRVELGEQARRITHHEGGKLFGLITAREQEGGHETNFVRFLDSTTFGEVSNHALDPLEMGCSIASVQFEGQEREYIIVGTAYIKEDQQDQHDPSTGRLLAFGVEGEGAQRKVTMIAETEVSGAVYSLGTVSGKLVAAVNSSVEIYDWQDREHGMSELVEKTSYSGNILVPYMKCSGDTIAVGDVMRSISVLRLKDDAKLEEVARDYNANWMTAVEILDDHETFLGAENYGNIFTVCKNTQATTDEARARLEPRGDFHVGEFINVFVKGSLVMQLQEPDRDSGVAGTPVLFGGQSGMIGCIIPITPKAFDFFNRLQVAMTKVVQGVGGFEHRDWRAFSNQAKPAQEARGFVDGDLIESFLDLPKAQQERVVTCIRDDFAGECSLPPAMQGGTAAAAASGSTAMPPHGMDTSGTSDAPAADMGGWSHIGVTVDSIIARVDDFARMH